jgi:hypothetical protein
MEWFFLWDNHSFVRYSTLFLGMVILMEMTILLNKGIAITRKQNVFSRKPTLFNNFFKPFFFFFILKILWVVDYFIKG